METSSLDHGQVENGLLGGGGGDKIYDEICSEKLLHYIIACHLQLFCVSRKIFQSSVYYWVLWKRSADSELLGQKACLKCQQKRKKV